MSEHRIDFESLSDEDRFGLIESLLGLLPSGPDFKSRAVFVAFQLAGSRPQEQIEGSLQRLADVRPGFFEEVLRVAKDIHGVKLEEVV